MVRSCWIRQQWLMGIQAVGANHSSACRKSLIIPLKSSSWRVETKLPSDLCDIKIFTGQHYVDKLVKYSTCPYEANILFFFLTLMIFYFLINVIFLLLHQIVT